jgi:MSHA pilin protein MshC
MNQLRKQAGFTMVELIASIVIIGILAATLETRFIGNNVFAERGYADEVAAALRYAQAVAGANGCGVTVTLNANNYVAAQPTVGPPACNGGWNTAVLRADGGPLAGPAPNGIVLQPAGQVTFNAQGRIVGGPPPQLHVAGFTLNIDNITGRVTVQ